MEIENVKQCLWFDNCNHKDCTTDFCLRKYKLDDLFKNTQLAPSQWTRQKLVVDSDPRYNDSAIFYQLQNIEKDIINFVKQGKNLYLYSSNSGNGKTSWAVRMIQAYCSQIWPTSSFGCHALFVSVPRFLDAIKENFTRPNAYAQFVMDNVMTADLVVWDEVAAKSGSEYDMNKLLGYIDSRVASGKANIYTSNVDFPMLQQYLGTRLASRIYQLSTAMKFNGTDKRSLQVKNEVQ